MEGFRVFIPETESPETVTINIYKPTPEEIGMIKSLAEKGVLTTLSNLIEPKVEAPDTASLEEDDKEACKKFVSEALTESHGRVSDDLLLRMFKTCSTIKDQPGAYEEFKTSLPTMDTTTKDACYQAWMKVLGIL